MVGLLLNAGPASKKAPELAFDIPGKGQHLLSQYRGKVVALEIIETTCPHCQAASHVMTRLQKEFASQGFQALDVAINPNADLLVDGFVKDQQAGFPVGWTTFQQAQAFLGLKPTERFVVPQVCLINPRGYIEYQTPPLGDDDIRKEDVLRQHVVAMLAASKKAAAKRRRG
ncbi:MAG TPA: TlpA disulfide reductase family protein [Bryobacteraceae bacterium]|nr:TlpA disulfide reductase family protein [Bryobacteraceae bacterium]